MITLLPTGVPVCFNVLKQQSPGGPARTGDAICESKNVDDDR